MKITVVDNEDLQRILKRLEDLEQNSTQESGEPPEKWVDNEGAARVLNASKRTLQNWRDTGKLGFSQPIEGGKIYYRLEDIHAFLNEHYRPAFSNPK